MLYAYTVYDIELKMKRPRRSHMTNSMKSISPLWFVSQPRPAAPSPKVAPGACEEVLTLSVGDVGLHGLDHPAELHGVDRARAVGILMT